MGKRAILCLLFCLLWTAWAQAGTWQSDMVEIHLGESRDVFFDGGGKTVYLTDGDGRALSTLEIVREETAGRVTLDTSGLEIGHYRLFLTGEGAAESMDVQILPPLPEILFADAPEVYSDTFQIQASVNVPGTLQVMDGERVLGEVQARAGDTTFLNLRESPGSGMKELTLVLRDERGQRSGLYVLDVLFPEPEPAHRAQDQVIRTPSELSGVDCGETMSFWNLPMDIREEEKIWQVLTSPVTVLSGNERHQYRVRREADENCTEYTGEVTCESQGVQVLETAGEWTRILAYSSSVEGSRVGVFSKCFTGYVETSLLKEKEVSQEIGLVVDKLQQRLYVFRNGHLFSTLLCSTGYARADTPFHETPAGEYLAISHTGGFWAGNLFCDMGIRINDGILLHEVPCTIEEAEDGSQVRHYERCEYYLGEKASHGCIRIQKERTPQGVNMKWLWENMPRSGNRAKVIIWDDSDRTLVPASDDWPLYYNPDNGRQYHSDPYCSLVNQKFLPLTGFTYGELEEGRYASLSVCPGCSPEARAAEVEVMNRKNKGHAYGDS